MAGSVQRQKVYVQVTELWLLAKALRATSITPESPAKPRQIDPHFTHDGPRWSRSNRMCSCGLMRRACSPRRYRRSTGSYDPGIGEKPSITQPKDTPHDHHRDVCNPCRRHRFSRAAAQTGGLSESFVRADRL